MAHGGNDIDIGIEAHAVGGGEEADAADQDALRGGGDGLLDGLLPVEARDPVLLVPRRQQDGVVHGRAQLDGGNQDRAHKGQLRAGEIRDAQIRGDGQLNHAHQDDRQGNRLLHQQDDDKDGDDRDQADHGEIMVRAGDQILGAGGLADKHAALIVLLQDAVQRVDLRVDLVGGDDIRGVDQHQLIAVSLDQPQGLRGQDALRDVRAQQAVDAVHAGDPVHLLHFGGHAAHLRLGDVGIHQQQMGGGRAEGLLQLPVGHHGGQILRHDPAHVIVDVHMAVAVEGGDAQQRQHHGQNPVMLGHEAPDAAHIRQQRPVAGLFDGAVQQPDHAGQQDNRPQQAQHDALAHHDA